MIKRGCKNFEIFFFLIHFIEIHNDRCIILRYEVDERRRKKWDQQRIREEKNIDRLR